MVDAGKVDAGTEMRGEVAAMERDPVFNAFMAAVRKEGFFDGIKRGSAEHDRLNHKVLTAYRIKMGGLTPEARDRLVAASVGNLGPMKQAKRSIMKRDEPQDQMARLALLLDQSDLSYMPSELAETPPARGDSKAFCHKYEDDAPEEEPKVLINVAAIYAQKEAEQARAQGNDAMQLGDYAAAVLFYTHAIEASPNGPHAHLALSNRASAACRMRDYRSAVKDLKAALKLVPDHSKHLARLGYVYLKWGRPREARDALTKSLVLEDSISVRTYIAEANKLLSTEANVSVKPRSRRSSKQAVTDEEDGHEHEVIMSSPERQAVDPDEQKDLARVGSFMVPLIGSPVDDKGLPQAAANIHRMSSSAPRTGAGL
eukprot:TRINITY_DN31140_c0_g1_i1.p1 TRINITY_DN31140_c0_g1~~TRINITY_DN31140_c0_g1_i1.p1  ORF type:complete len:371 (+),score=69.45 TRINITY_DN31140_c0_g1_i1:118-1230(+)